MLPVDYLPGARRDFDESFDWYAEQSSKRRQPVLRMLSTARFEYRRPPIPNDLPPWTTVIGSVP